jgi:prepilin-type processing-associated H-X9-DG protein
MTNSNLHGRSAFTRVELLFTVCGVVLVLAILVVAIPRLRGESQLSQCRDNLKNVTLGLILWTNDADDRRFQVPWRTPVDQKGTANFEPASRRSECWFQLMAFSNQLAFPKFLADPADYGTRVATTWDANPTSGIAAPGFQDRACSYAFAADYRFGWSGLWHPDDPPPGEFIFLDRHLGPGATLEQCSAGFSGTAFKQPFNVWWSQEVHGQKGGNVSFPDGSVRVQSAKKVVAMLPANADYSTPGRSAHFLFPQRPKVASPRSKDP